jgi:hypothetical protein
VKTAARLCVALALLTLAASCGPGAVPIRESTRAFTASDYGGIYDRWTRTADEFDFGHLAEVLHVTATFESWEFRWAYVVRYAQDHSLTTDERTRTLEQSLADARDRHRFLVTVGVPIFREGDLTSTYSDVRVILVDPEGRQTTPSEILRIGRPSTDQRIYFPSINRQRHTFRIAFPTLADDGTPTIPEGARQITLRFAGALGTVDLHWDLDQSGAATPTAAE